MQIASRFLSIMALLSMIFGGYYAPPGQPSIAWQSKVDPWVLSTEAGGETEFLVYLAEQADLSAAGSLPTKLDKGTYVFETLTEIAARTQAPVLAELKASGVEHRAYWVANMIWVRGGANVVQAMAERSDIAHIYANPQVKLDRPAFEPQTGTPAAPEAIEWNINWVNAPDVWAQGFTGQGVVIGGQDTGYEWDHPALINQYRGWDGSSSNHSYNWHDAIHSGSSSCGVNSPVPCDDYGHGTHTMGTMVGDDGGGNQTGMAPGARWIGCRNMRNGVGTPATYSECYEWFIAPYPIGSNPTQGDPSMAPDVINNSWGCPVSEGCTNPNVLLTVVNNVRAAGILTAHSAGNSGSGCSTVNDPAAIYDVSFTVGATGNHSDTIASFSSRGPVIVDGSNRMKPDISAPGVGILSSVPGGGYWVSSGTSMAAPHVAGLVGLLISANPGLAGQVDTLEMVIEQSAVPRTTSQGCGGDGSESVPNNVYGWGRIDALGALQYHGFDITKTRAPEIVLPGEVLTYTIDLNHIAVLSPTTNVVLRDTIPTGASFITATLPHIFDGSTVSWEFASMDANQTQTVELVVLVEPAARGQVVNDQYGARSDDILAVLGEPVVTTILSSEMALSKAAPAVVLPGEVLTYTLTVTNPYTTIPLNNVVLTDVIPANTTFISATGTYTLENGIARWDFPSLGPSEALAVDLVVQPQVNGTVTNQVYGADALEADPVLGLPVSTDVMPYVLELAKRAPESVAAGDVLTYTLTVTNPHPLALTQHLVLTDVLPADAAFITATQPVSISGSLITWTLPSLAPGTTWSELLAVRVPAAFEGSVVNEHYGVRSDKVAALTGPPVTTAIYALSLAKSASAQVVSRGDLLTYTLQVTNQHPLSDTTDLVLTDTLPINTAFITATQPNTLSGGMVAWSLPSLGSGETWSVQLTVQVLPEASTAIVNDEYSVISGEISAPVFGEPVVTGLRSYLFLPLVNNQLE